MPLYDFSTGMRQDDAYRLRLGRDEMLIVEGIHGLNPVLHKGFRAGEVCKFYLSELTCLNLDDHNRIRTTDARLLRRIVRDYQFRGTTPGRNPGHVEQRAPGRGKMDFPLSGAGGHRVQHRPAL